MTLQERAREVLDPQAYDYAVTGSGIEETIASNRSAWRDAYLRPRVLRDVATVDTTTSVLGTTIAAPVAVAPVAYQRWFHPDGEAATAKGAGESLFVLSTRATSSFDEVAPVSGAWWFQLYVLNDRGLTEALVRRAVAGGAGALVVTVDTPGPGAKARPTQPPDHVLAHALLPELRGRERDRTAQARDLTWSELDWLRSISGGLPLVLKGIMRADDARAAVAAGAAAIWVSNHGGRQLDGVMPTAVALPEVADAVGDQAEIYVDGGIRTGRDVLRALALGARVGFLGRPAVWALATGGAGGVQALLRSMQAEVREALALAGCRSPAEVTPDLVSRALSGGAAHRPFRADRELGLFAQVDDHPGGNPGAETPDLAS